jgi:pyridinium-3,5-biscarboxylic acid mononucleotide synthase
MTSQDLKHLAARLIEGSLSIDDFVARAGHPLTADLGEARVDLDRHSRCGLPEVIFAEGKTVAMIERIIETMLHHGVDVLTTRLSPDQAAELLKKHPSARYNAIGRTFRIEGRGERGEGRGLSSSVLNSVESRGLGTSVPSAKEERKQQGGLCTSVPSAEGKTGRVVIVTAGTSDLPVAEEARETALWTGADVTLIADVGVAGPHRLTENLPLLRSADAVVVVAGMEGALPSVVGGHVACPVIAVPTSVGYGASFGGVAALLGMLNSCSSNVTVVNIDAGFKGGYVAGLIAKNVARERVNKL